MKLIRSRVLSWILTIVMVYSMLPMTVLAAGNDVARIGDVTYATLDDAVTAANASKEAVIIELLQSCSVGNRISISAGKNITITAMQNSGITITDNTRKGITLSNGSTLTIENIAFNTNGQIYLNGSNGSLTFRNAELSMDGEMYQFNRDGYYCSAIAIEQPENALTFDGCEVSIKNYPSIGSAVRWNPNSNSYFVEIINGTRFESSNCYAGFTGTLNVKIQDSTVNVHDHRGNGANGAHYDIDGSVVNFYDNGSHGLSTTNLSITDSKVIASGNSYIGIAVAGSLTIEQDSVVTVTGNAYGSLGYAAMRLYYDYNYNVDSTSKLYIKDNYNTGLYIRQGNLTVEDGAILEITGNKVTNSHLDGYGGGLYVGYGNNYDPTVILPSDAVIYNNHSTKGGDDIYVSEGVNGPSLTFGTVGKGWALDGDPDCEDIIDGWYDDSEGSRWEAHAENEEDNHIVEFTDFTDGLATVTGLTQLKAAHGADAQSKTSLPGLEKWILQENGEDDEIEVASDSVAAKETITFELKSNVPENLLDYINYPVDEPEVSTFALGDVEEDYILTFHDEMDEALVLDEDSFTVKIGDSVLANSYYSIENDPSDTCTFEVVLNLSELYNDDLIKESDLGTTAITVTYEAALAEDVEAGSYQNTAWVSYLEDKSAPRVVVVRTYGINIFKFDSVTNRGLAGAEFVLTDADGTELQQVVSGNDGYVRIDGLDEGVYKLTETKAPDGYVKSDVPLEIEITVDADRDNVIDVRFANTPVPHTGGTGTRMYTIAGAVIVIGAGALLVVSRRKKED